MGAYGLSFLAGSLTTLNPCVLPLLPIVLASAAQENRFGPAALIAGVIISFAGFGSLVAALGFGLGFDPLLIRIFAAALLIAAGVILLSGQANAMFVRVTAPLTAGAQGAISRIRPSGASGQFLLGFLLGAVWTPCVGPTFGAAIGLAAQRETFGQALALMIVFGVGLGVVMVALAYGSRRAIASRKTGLQGVSRWGKPVMGGALVLVGIAVVTGFDKVVETALVNIMPDWLVVITTSI